MSFEDIHKRRRIIQKLDFENCIVTSIKTRARGRKKLRARISREIAGVSKETQPREKSPSVSPVLTRKTHSEDAEPTSPVLIKKQCRNSGSPVFFKRKILDSLEKCGDNLSESLTIEEIPSSPGSPVFKTFKKYRLENISLNSSRNLKSVLHEDTETRSSNSQENSSSDRQSSFQIDECTQESKQSLKISSVDSAEVKKDNFMNFSTEQNVDELNTFCQHSPEELPNGFSAREKPVKRHYKKNSLLGRLHKLQQKQASEKLLWQHQNRKKSTGSLKFSIINFWKEEFNYFIKCQSILSDFEKMFLIVDSRWVPNVKKIKENSVLQLHPPWQKLIVEESTIVVLLNVICLDVLDETKEPIVQKKTLETVPANLCKTDKKLFVDSLFFSCGSGFLC